MLNISPQPFSAPIVGFIRAPGAVLGADSQTELEALTCLVRLFFQAEYCFLSLTREFATRVLGAKAIETVTPLGTSEGEEDEFCLDTRNFTDTQFLPKLSSSQWPQHFARSPMVGRAGARIGSLCVSYRQPRRDLTSRESEALQHFSVLAAHVIEQRLGSSETIGAVEEVVQAADRVRYLLESTTDGVVLLNSNWVISFINKSANEMIAGGHDLLGTNFWRSFPNSTGGDLEEQLLLAMRENSEARFETTYPDPATLVEVHIQPTGDDLAVFFKDITEKRTIAIELQRIEARYRLVTLATVDGIWDWDHATGETYFSARWQEIIGLPPIDITADISHWFDRLHPRDTAGVMEIYNRPEERITSEFTHEWRVRHENGEWLWILSRCTVVCDHAGRPLRTVGSNRDITHERSRDPLSSLHNRGSLLEYLERCIENLSSDGKIFALLVFDIDDFQQVNDRFGEHQGDLVLIEIAARLEATMKNSKESLVARVSADEFAVVLGGVVEVQDAITYAHCVHELIGKILCCEETLSISVSIGIAMGDEGYEYPSQLLENAGIAMHQAKAQGDAKTVVFAAQMRTENIRRVQLEADLRHAVEKSQLVLHYQSKVSLEDGEILGYEALVRWLHPVRGMIPPDDFIPYAEESGLIIELGEWTLYEALRQLMHWRAVGFVTDKVTMAVNLSTRQFNDPALCSKVLAALHAQQAPASCLTLEVTESAMIGDLEHAKKILSGLRALGVSLDLDDFGTGYSSLSYLHKLPFQSLKIDRSFTSQLEDSQESRAIARSILQLGKSLRLAVIAEGIENEAQRAWLVRLGCQFGQGYLYSQPDAPLVLERAEDLHSVLPERFLRQA